METTSDLVEIELIRDIMVVLVTAKIEDLIINEGARVLTILNINFTDIQGQLTALSFQPIWSKCKRVQDTYYVFISAKNDGDSSKHEGAIVLIILNINFSNHQGQLTLDL